MELKNVDQEFIKLFFWNNEYNYNSGKSKKKMFNLKCQLYMNFYHFKNSTKPKDSFTKN